MPDGRSCVRCQQPVRRCPGDVAALGRRKMQPRPELCLAVVASTSQLQQWSVCLSTIVRTATVDNHIEIVCCCWCHLPWNAVHIALSRCVMSCHITIGPTVTDMSDQLCLPAHAKQAKVSCLLITVGVVCMYFIARTPNRLSMLR